MLKSESKENIFLDFKQKYNEEIAPALQKKYELSSVMAVPRLVKIVINQGIGKAISQPKILDRAAEELSNIAGQRVTKTFAKYSISNFKLRKGMGVGLKVTLRRDAMYHFLKKLIWIALPRISDLRGYSVKSFDKQGNFTFGIKEQFIFPESNLLDNTQIRGMDITICMKTSLKHAKRELFQFVLEKFGFPIVPKLDKSTHYV